MEADKETADEEEEDVLCTVCGRPFTRTLYSLLMFVLVFVLLYADQNALAPHLSTIQKEFNMTENERDVYLGGYINLGFFGVGSLVSIMIGPLVDSVNRTYLLAALVTFTELACAATFFAVDFTTLLVARAFTGFGIGGGVPLVYSLLGDLVSEKNRGKANAGIVAAFGIGATLGQQVSAAFDEDWRSPFLVISLPAIALAVVMVFTVREPERGGAEVVQPGTDGSTRMLTIAKAKEALSTPTVVFAVLQAVPGTLPYGVVIVFLNDFLIVEKGISDKSIASLVTYSFGVPVLIGIFIGGWLIDKYFDNYKSKVALFAAVTTIISAFPLAAFYYYDTSSIELGGAIALYCFMIGISALLTGFSGGIIRPMLLNVSLPETRGTIFAIQNLVDELGKGVGPFLVSQIIVGLGSRANGLTVAALMFIPAGLFQLGMAYYIEGDYKAKEEKLVQTADQTELAPTKGPVLQPSNPLSL